MNADAANQPSAFHLAQVNVARMRAPLGDPEMAGFVAGLAPVNALADTAPGFVWRLQDEESGDATDHRPFGDAMILVNLSVWEGPEPLRHFVYHTLHQQFLKQRRDWFERMAEAWVALWWVPAGHRPSVVEAHERLEQLRAHGDTAEAFTFRQLFPPPTAAPA